MQQETSAGDDTPTMPSPPETTSEPSLKWEPLVLTEEKLVELWEKLQTFEMVWDDFSKGDFNAFVDKLMSRDTVLIDIGPGVGLAAGFAVRPRLDMIVHLIMFDRRLRGRESLLKEIMFYFFDKLKLRRITAVVSQDVKTAVKLVTRLGFVHEGTMRKAILRKGEYIDAEVFGMLKEELEWPL